MKHKWIAMLLLAVVPLCSAPAYADEAVASDAGIALDTGTAFEEASSLSDSSGLSDDTNSALDGSVEIPDHIDSLESGMTLISLPQSMLDAVGENNVKLTNEEIQSQLTSSLASLASGSGISSADTEQMYTDFMNMSSNSTQAFGKSFTGGEMSEALNSFYDANIGKTVDMDSLNLSYKTAAATFQNVYSSKSLSGKADSLFQQFDKKYNANSLNATALLNAASSSFKSAYGSTLDTSAYKALKSSIGASGILSNVNGIAAKISDVASKVSAGQANNESEQLQARSFYASSMNSYKLTQQLSNISLPDLSDQYIDKKTDTSSTNPGGADFSNWKYQENNEHEKNATKAKEYLKKQGLSSYADSDQVSDNTKIRMAHEMSAGNYNKKTEAEKKEDLNTKLNNRGLIDIANNDKISDNTKSKFAHK